MNELDPTDIQRAILAHYGQKPRQEPPDAGELAPGHVRVFVDEDDYGSLNVVLVPPGKNVWSRTTDVPDQLYQDYLTARRDLDQAIAAIESFEG